MSSLSTTAALLLTVCFSPLAGCIEDVTEGGGAIDDSFLDAGKSDAPFTSLRRWSS